MTSVEHARDIANVDFLRAVQLIADAKGYWANRWEVGVALGDIYVLPEEIPEKVVMAKARRLINRGLMTGCPCGCRGDFELTTAGIVHLGMVGAG